MQLLWKQQYVEIAKEVELSKKKQLEDDQQIGNVACSSELVLYGSC